MLLTGMLSTAVSANETMIEPGCDAASDIKSSGAVNAINVTGVGGSASQLLTIQLSDGKSYYTRADTLPGVFAGYVALLSNAYFNKKPVTLRYGCEVGMRVIHRVDLP
jgi:hypothetical protein